MKNKKLHLYLSADDPLLYFIKHNISQPPIGYCKRILFNLIVSCEDLFNVKERIPHLNVFYDDSLKKSLLEFKALNEGVVFTFFCKTNNIPTLSWIKQIFNPNGFYTLNDLDFSRLYSIIVNNLKHPFYTQNIVNQLERGNQLDKLDYELLERLKMGCKPMKLHHYLPASKSVIFRRKKRLKEIMGVLEKTDAALVAQGIKLGYLKLDQY